MAIAQPAVTRDAVRPDFIHPLRGVYPDDPPVTFDHSRVPQPPLVPGAVTVRNVAPTVTAVNLSAATIDEGQSVTVRGTFGDPAFGVVTGQLHRQHHDSRR